MAERPTTPSPAPVEDIFAETQPSRPPLPVPPGAAPRRVRPAPARGPLPSGGRSRFRFLFIIIGVIGVLGIAGAVTWTILGGQTPADNVNSTPAAQNTSVQPPPTANTNSTVPPLDEPPAGPPDQDRDGLTDEEEQTLGTDAGAVDTDRDGLSDLLEVRVYQTDPKAADTDKDSFADGVEVREGYNPAGEGLLRDLDQGISTIDS